MGNSSTGHKRRSSLDDEFPPTGNNAKRMVFQYPQEDDSVISILTDGIAIDAIADQLRESRIRDADDKPRVYFGADDVDEAQNFQNVPTVFKWEGGGKDVYISGTFNGWKSKIPMVRSSSKENFYTIVDLPLGEHQYKFIVDGQWKIDQKQPIITGTTGVQNNMIQVRESDFDVLTALSHDIATSRGAPDDSGNTGVASPGTPIRAGGAAPDVNLPDLDNLYAQGGRSPPGEYGRIIPSSPLDAMKIQAGSGTTISVPSTSPPVPPYPPTSPSASESAKKVPNPPMLPPQLLQVILNRDTSAHCDPNLLPQPDHVMVNHMYALSIKDGVIVLSAITRYRQKFVSTVLYKPI